MTLPCKHISVSINRVVADVYQFASNPLNLPLWAAGLSQAKVIETNDGWIAESPLGRVKVNFTDKNNLGVLDHDVTLPTGEVNHNPFRVVANGEGSEVIFTLYRLPQMSDEDFENDAQMILKDLTKLKALVEMGDT